MTAPCLHHNAATKNLLALRVDRLGRIDPLERVLAAQARPRRILDWRPLLAIGTVKWFNAQKGFGFIQPDDGGKDVFVHISAVERAGLGGLNEGQKIQYDVQMDRGKASAGNLSVVK